MRQPEPYFRSQKNAWYVNLDGRRISLGHDKKEAWATYSDLMAGRSTAKKGDPRIVALISQFTDWLNGYTCPTTGKVIQGHRRSNTGSFYLRSLLLFAEHIGDRLTVSQIKVHHVTKWLEGMGITDESDPRRFPHVRSVKRLFNWAVEQELIESAPLKTLFLGEGGKREVLISGDQWKQIFEVSNPKCHDLLHFVHETGCRPQELRAIEAKHFDAVKKTVHFTAAENPKKAARGKTRPRTIYLSDLAAMILAKLVAKYPAGKLFRNTRGKPWTRDGLVQFFGRVKEKTGIAGLCCYVARHSWANDALDSTDSLTVAELMGHKDLRMLTKHYAHLQQKQAKLRDAVQSVANRQSSAEGQQDSHAIRESA